MIIKEITKDNPLLPLVAPVLNAGQTNFVIQFEPSYRLNQRTDATFSVPSTVQEIGAARGSVVPPVPPNTGNGEVTVMRVQFRAFGGGSVRVQADHADSPQLPTAVFDANAVPIPGPLAVSDDQVFIHQAGTLQILPLGSPEGEFTNQVNAHDVNGDGDVNQIDILMLVNDLTQNGPRPLNQLLIALDGLLPAGYLDVNIDALVNIVDILSLINYLTANSGHATGGGSGEGEAEGEGTGVAAASIAGGSIAASQAVPDAGDALGAMVNFLAWEQSQDELTLASGEASDAAFTSLSAPRIDSALPGTATAAATTGDSTTTSTDSELESVDTLAADELYASLVAVGNQFKRLRLARW
jgi:dockerin type I repeat protein